jgi:hypothetical protein
MTFSTELNENDFFKSVEWERLFQMSWIETAFSIELNEAGFFKRVEWERLLQMSWMRTTSSNELNENRFFDWLEWLSVMKTTFKMINLWQITLLRSLQIFILLTCCITTLISITTLIDLKLDLLNTTTTTARTTTSFIYYVMCFEVRFYNYLALSKIKKKLSSKLVIITLSLKMHFSWFLIT